MSWEVQVVKLVEHQLYKMLFPNTSAAPPPPHPRRTPTDTSTRDHEPGRVIYENGTRTRKLRKGRFKGVVGKLKEMSGREKNPDPIEQKTKNKKYKKAKRT
jgi:hypothetical protein